MQRRGTAFGSSGYRAWLSEPTSTGCIVVTEETQCECFQGLIAGICNPALLREHQPSLERRLTNCYAR